jgi:hypothetical protein
MDLEATQFHALVRAVFAHREQGYRDGAPLAADQADRIVGLARLVVSADRGENAEERALLATLVGHVRALANGDAGPIDDGDRRDDRARGVQLASLASDLHGGAAELAYVVAYLLTIADLAIDPAEEVFLEALRAALAISEDRADELHAAIGDVLAPAV